jgi:hypothetical protein
MWDMGGTWEGFLFSVDSLDHDWEESEVCPYENSRISVAGYSQIPYR